VAQYEEKKGSQILVPGLSENEAKNYYIIPEIKFMMFFSELHPIYVYVLNYMSAHPKIHYSL